MSIRKLQPCELKMLFTLFCSCSLFLEVIRSTSQDCLTVKFRSDGSWFEEKALNGSSAPTEKDKSCDVKIKQELVNECVRNGNTKSKKKSANIECITLSDSDDEDNDDYEQELEANPELDEGKQGFSAKLD